MTESKNNVEKTTLAALEALGMTPIAKRDTRRNIFAGEFIAAFVFVFMIMALSFRGVFDIRTPFGELMFFVVAGALSFVVVYASKQTVIDYARLSWKPIRRMASAFMDFARENGFSYIRAADRLLAADGLSNRGYNHHIMNVVSGLHRDRSFATYLHVVSDKVDNSNGRKIEIMPSYVVFEFKLSNSWPRIFLDVHEGGSETESWWLLSDLEDAVIETPQFQQRFWIWFERGAQAEALSVFEPTFLEDLMRSKRKLYDFEIAGDRLLVYWRTFPKMRPDKERLSDMYEFAKVLVDRLVPMLDKKRPPTKEERDAFAKTSSRALSRIPEMAATRGARGAMYIAFGITLLLVLWATFTDSYEAWPIAIIGGFMAFMVLPLLGYSRGIELAQREKRLPNHDIPVRFLLVLAVLDLIYVVITYLHSSEMAVFFVGIVAFIILLIKALKWKKKYSNKEEE